LLFFPLLYSLSLSLSLSLFFFFFFWHIFLLSPCYEGGRCRAYLVNFKTLYFLYHISHFPIIFFNFSLKFFFFLTFFPLYIISITYYYHLDKRVETRTIVMSQHTQKVFGSSKIFKIFIKLLFCIS